MRHINRCFPILALLSLAVPALAGWALTGTLAGAAGGLLWGGLVRIFLVHHITWSVNSVCHFLGNAPLPDGGPLDQRGLARAALLRRGVAPQSPRVPPLGCARAAPMGAVARSRGTRHHDAREGRSRPERRQDRPRAAASAGGPGRAGACRSRRLTRMRRFSPATDPYLLPDGLPRPLLRGLLHLGAFVAAVGLGVALVLVAGPQDAPAFAVYGLGVAGLFGVSALYHRGRWRPRRESAAPARRPLHDLRPDRRDLYADLRARPGWRSGPGAARRRLGRRPDGGGAGAATETCVTPGRARRALDCARLGRSARAAGRCRPISAGSRPR